MTPAPKKPWTVWTPVVANIIANAPVTSRALARASGVSHAELARIVAGRRNVTKRVAEQVVKGFARLAAEHRALAGRFSSCREETQEALRRGV
jgi:plasmid maintenance system antidote protein VapI